MSFTPDELEDLHRGLAFDTEQTDDKKRRKLLNKILDKIDDLLAEEDDDLVWEPDDEWLSAPPAPGSPQEMFQQLFGGVPGPPPSKTPTCQVTLGKAERETLLAMDSMPGDIRKLLAVNTVEEHTFEFSQRQFLVMSITLKESLELATDEDRRHQLADVARRLSDGLFDAMEESRAADLQQRYHTSQGPNATIAFQLKITLEGSKPPIWRRVQVGDCTLDVLHDIIQTAMGWEDYHLHMFEWDGNCFSHPEAQLDGDDCDETRVLLSQLVADGCKKLRYWYDFGDDWWHAITIEKTLKPKRNDRFPTCLKGVGACPPEDCGGIWGYLEFLEAIRDPKHDRHSELVAWAGDDFDPTHFDIDEVNVALAK